MARHRIAAAFAVASLLTGAALPSAALAQPASAPGQSAGAPTQPTGSPAQQDAAPPPPVAGPKDATPPAKPADQADAPPKTVSTTDPNLAVATVRLEGGYRASKVIGAAVYNAQNQQIGSVDDIIMNHQNQADLVVISVGGVLGVGSKLVALPFGKIERTDSAKVMLQDGNKDTLMKLPSFTYTQ